jgi:protein TonB
MMKYIQQNIQYPPKSIEMNEQGTVYLSFVVETDGTISNVAIERGVSIDIDKEAKRIVRNMPKWSPGESKGKKCRTRCRVPINFQLS